MAVDTGVAFDLPLRGPMGVFGLLFCKVTRPIEVVEQPWVGRFPTQLVTGEKTRRRIVGCGEVPEPAEALGRVFGRYGFNRNAQLTANDSAMERNGMPSSATP